MTKNVQPQRTRRHRGHGGKIKTLSFSLCSLCLCVLCGGIAAAATVQTVDDATIKDATITFDGQVVSVVAGGKPTPTTMPLEDVARIILREPAAPVETPPGGTPAPMITRVRRTTRRAATTQSAGNPVTNLAAAATMPASTKPSIAISPNWRMKLTDGDALHGALESWVDQHLIIRPDVASAAKVEIAAEGLDWLWHGEAADQAKAEAMKTARGDEDVAFVRKEKDADIVAIRGAAVGVDGDELVFRYEGEDRRINLSKIIGIVFAQHPAKPDDSFHQVVRFVDGEQVSGRWRSLENNILSLETVSGKQTKFQLSSVAGIDFRNGRIVYLSDLTPTKVEQTPFFDEVIPYKTDAALDGSPLRLGDQAYDKGLAVHSRCVLEYDLGGRFDRFKTKMGFEPGAGALGDASVRVLGDGKALYENARAKGTDSPVAIDVDTTGISQLTLEVDFGEGQDVGDRIVWADARAVRAKVGG